MIFYDIKVEYNPFIGALVFFPVAIIDATEKRLSKFQMCVSLFALLVSYNAYTNYCNACNERPFWISNILIIIVVLIASRLSTKVSDLLDNGNKIDK